MPGRVTVTAADLERLKQSFFTEIDRRDRAAALRISTDNKLLLDAVIDDYGRMAAAKTKSDERIKALEAAVSDLIQNQAGGR
jgi:hypothetical protein